MWHYYESFLNWKLFLLIKENANQKIKQKENGFSEKKINWIVKTVYSAEIFVIIIFK